jgi:hypothetical protein
MVRVFVDPFVRHFLSAGFHQRLRTSGQRKKGGQKGEVQTFHMCNLELKSKGLQRSAILLRHEKEGSMHCTREVNRLNCHPTEPANKGWQSIAI